MDARKLRAAIVAEYGTQSVFAEKIGWHKNKVSRIIQGKYKPDTDEVANMVKILHLSESQFCDIFLPAVTPNGDKII